MSRPKHLQTMLTAVGLAVAIGAGFLAMNQFQRTVPIVPGIEGCFRLDGTARRTDCLASEFRTGVNEVTKDKSGSGRNEALITYVSRVDKLAAGDSRLAGTCHPAMHVVGRDEGQRAARRGYSPEFPGGASQLCTAGYVHGIAEGYLMTSRNPDVESVFPKLCHDEGARPGCAHGIGHALLQTSSSPDLEDARRAVELCREIPSKVVPDCHAGIFMELAMRTKPRPIPVQDFVDTCSSWGGGELELSCYNYLGLSLTTNEIPAADTPEWCAKAPYGAQFTCIEGYGRQLGVTKVSYCESASRKTVMVQRCINGAIALQVGSGHVSADDARRSCRTIDNRKLADFCDGAVARYSRGRAKLDAEI